jgi:hypothetical protein
MTTADGLGLQYRKYHLKQIRGLSAHFSLSSFQMHTYCTHPDILCWTIEYALSFGGGASFHRRVRLFRKATFFQASLASRDVRWGVGFAYRLQE